MKDGVVDFMRRYAESKPIRLHTPGHKGTLDALDITELADGSFPETQVEAVQREIARVYGARNARLLSCGSSQGVKAAVYYTDTDGIIDVNSHRSVFDGYTLSKHKASVVGRRGDVRPITVADIDGALESGTGAVVVTSPTYFGFVADIDGIADYCKRKGLMFVVDGAHGAHFGFSEKLPPAFAPKCDICNVSAHKTLSALTGSAVLFDNLDGAQSDRLSECVRIMGTTSPLYPMYASIESAVDEARRGAERYAKLFDCIQELKSNFPFLNNDDFTRPVLDCAALGVNGKELNAALSRRGVYAELATDRYLVFIFTPADDAAAVVPKLIESLRASIRETK